MTTVIAFAIAFSLAASVFAGPAASQPATRTYGDDPLGALEDRRRVLVVFSADRADERLAVMKEIVRDESDGFDDRELTVVWIVAGRGEIQQQPLSAVATASVLKKCDVAAGGAFSVVLVGKDGGVKRRESAPIEAADLFATIDAMPMRKQEMRDAK